MAIILKTNCIRKLKFMRLETMVSVLNTLFGSIRNKVNNIMAKNQLTKEKSAVKTFNVEEKTNNTVTNQTPLSLNVITYTKHVKSLADSCPQCGYFISEEKTVDTYIGIEGPIYLRKDISSKSFKPMVKLTKTYKCSKCGYVKSKRIMYIPLESIDLIEDFLPQDFKDTIGKIKDMAIAVEEILKKFIG